MQIFIDLAALVTSGDATTNPLSGPSAFDKLLRIGTDKYSMSIDTSGALGTVTQVLSGGQYLNVKMDISAFPALSASIKGGIEPGGSGV